MPPARMGDEQDDLAQFEPQDQDDQAEDRPDPRRLLSFIDHPNIANELEEDQLNQIGQKVVRERQLDDDTRADWKMRSEAAMDMAMQVAKAKQHPWQGASNVIYPLMTVAAVQFAARAYPAIVQGRNVVKGVVVGPDNGIPQVAPDGSPAVQMNQQGQPQPVWAQKPGSKRDRALRIGQHMSWQLLVEMKEWEEGTDKLLHILPIVGCCFRKTYFDKGLGRHVSRLVLPQHMVIQYMAESMERAPRLSEDIRLYPNEIEENVRAGLFIEHEYGVAADSNGDDDAPHEFIEQHRRLDLDEDDYPEPYIVTVHKATGKVARITAGFDRENIEFDRDGRVIRIEAIAYYTKYDFMPSLDGGIYGTGYGQLLGPVNAAVNTSLNMMFDAAHLQNTGGGFVGRGLSMHSGSMRFKLGEWKIVNSPGQTVREAIVPLQHQGPSAQLYQLLVFLVEAGKEIASVKDALTGEAAAATMQPTTLMALIEQGLKVFTAIYKRVHRACASEYDKLYRLNRVYLQRQARFQVGDEWKTVTQEDYARGGGVIPISDPAMVSDMQKAAKAQFLMGFNNHPLVKQDELLRRVFDAGQIEDPDKLMQPQPANPEIMAKVAEMELKGHEAEAKIGSAKAQQIKDLTQAVLNLANADKAVGDAHLGWIEQHIDMYRMQIEALSTPAQGTQEPGEGEGVPAAPVAQHLPAPPPALGGAPMPGSAPPEERIAPGLGTSVRGVPYIAHPGRPNPLGNP